MRDEDSRIAEPFKITPRFERRYLGNEKSYRFQINTVHEGEYFDSYDVRILEIFQMNQKLLLIKLYCTRLRYKLSIKPIRYEIFISANCIHL